MVEKMSVIHFEDLIKSDLFTFCIGEEKTTFVVHSQAIAATSDPFKALVNGSLAEATERSAFIGDIQPDDFVRFIEYAYRRDYSIPPWTPDDTPNVPDEDVPEPPPPPPDQSSEGPPSWPVEEPSVDYETEVLTPMPVEESTAEYETAAIPYAWGRIASNEKKKKKGLDACEVLRAGFRSLNYADKGLPNAILAERSSPYGNATANEDFTGILLAHARMYTLAETYLVDPLQTLALHKLHKTLCEFQLYDRRVRDIVDLCRYAYQNGHDRSEDGTVDRLRALVVEYIVTEVASFRTHELFVKFLEEGGEFVSDFWVKVAKHML